MIKKQMNQMLKKERQNSILNYLDLNGIAMASVLCDTLQVSHDTIRRDLLELSEDGQLIKVHGGALLPAQQTKEKLSMAAQLIAEKTTKLLYNDVFILTCGGDAVMEMYNFIPSTFRATLLTTCIDASSRYCEHPTMEVFQVGDRIHKTSKIAIGGEAIAKIRQVRADMCILEVTALDFQRGLTENNWQIAELKKAMIESADAIVCLAESSAIGKIAAIQVCAPQKLTYLVTELNPLDPSLSAYREKGIIVI
jgi:DeoR/GlpR family transcriptional regulator of sugar metabolism